MPTYTYTCLECDYTFDKLSKISEREAPTKEPCPNCGHDEIKMILTEAPQTVSGVRGRHPDWFDDKLKEMKKNTSKAGKDNLSAVIND